MELPSIQLFIIAAIFLVGGTVAIVRLVVPRVEKALKERQKKKVKEAKKKLSDVKNVVQPTVTESAPISVAPEAKTEQGKIKSLEEFPIGQKLGIEMTRVVEGTHKRIVIAKGKVAIKVKGRVPKIAKLLFFVWGEKAAYFVDPRKIIKVTIPGKKGKPETTEYKLVYDVLLGEALNQDGTVTWSDDLELILADSGLDQYVTVAAFEGGFQFTSTLRNIMIIVAILGLFFGIAIDGVEHFVPQTIIHWVP